MTTRISKNSGGSERVKKPLRGESGRFIRTSTMRSEAGCRTSKGGVDDLRLLLILAVLRTTHTEKIGDSVKSTTNPWLVLSQFRIFFYDLRSAEHKKSRPPSCTTSPSRGTGRISMPRHELYRGHTQVEVIRHYRYRGKTAVAAGKGSFEKMRSIFAV